MFTDILIKVDFPDETRFYPENSKVSDADKKALVQKLSAKIASLSQDAVDYNIECDGMSFRGHKQITEKGTFHALRRLAEKAMPFDDLKMPKGLKLVLLDESLCAGGLILVSGMTGAGKSTTMASLLSERLRLFGGLALTVENPVETLLSGEHGQHGYCLQTSVITNTETHEALRGAMRCFPSKQKQAILMLGEVRDATMAMLSLQAALSGHLVITTVHGGDIITALRRVASLAASNLMEGEAYSILSEVMRVTIHQRYENGIHKFSALANRDTASSIVRFIAENKMEKLSTDIQQQAVKCMKGDALW